MLRPPAFWGGNIEGDFVPNRRPFINQKGRFHPIPMASPGESDNLDEERRRFPMETKAFEMTGPINLGNDENLRQNTPSEC